MPQRRAAIRRRRLRIDPKVGMPIELTREAPRSVLRMPGSGEQAVRSLMNTGSPMVGHVEGGSVLTPFRQLEAQIHGS